MKTERITDRIEIVNADCYTLLDALPSDAALVTDPPYGIAYLHSGGGGRGKGLQGANRVRPEHGAKRKRIHGDDRPFDPFPFLRFAVVCLWGADKYRLRLPETGTMLAWDKDCGKGPEGSFCDCEYAWTSTKTQRNIFRHYWRGLCCSKQGEGLDNPNKFRRLHVSQKPVALMEWTLKTCAVPSDALVIDPFMGSGSLGVACHRAGLRYLGVEIDQEHYATAKARLQRETAQSTFTLTDRTPEPAPAIRQADML
jgi:site-specific DNA-methyltransferase (adenine-specific)